MNILVQDLPKSVVVDGRSFKINTDFKTALRVILAFEDPELTTIEKQSVLIRNLFVRLPSNTYEAIQQANWFLNGGNDEESDGPAYRLCSFEKDSKFIYAAFKQTHGIDLETARMHWWKFLSLFADLGSETVFCFIVSLRKRLKTGKATKEERALALEMKNIIDLPELDTRTLEEKEAANTFYKLWEQRKNAKDRG